MFNFFKEQPSAEDVAKAFFLSDMATCSGPITAQCISIMPDSMEREQELQFLRWMNEVQQLDDESHHRRLKNDG